MGATAGKRRYGSGSVYQLPNGRWSGQWSAGRDEYGARVRGTVTADTESAAWKALTDARAKSSSTKRRRGGESVAGFLARWLDDVVRPTRRERTLIGYRSIVDLHLVPAFGDKPLRSLGRREVQAWVNRSTGSPTSVRHRVDCLRAAMSYAVRWGLIDTNPASDLDLPSPVKRTVKALRPEDGRKVLEAMAGTWLAPLVTVALYTGLRQGELLALRWEDVNLAAPSLTVHKSLARLPGPRGTRYVLTDPKSAKSRRTVPLAQPAADTLRELKKGQLAGAGPWKGLVFPDGERPHDGTKLTHAFQDRLAEKELPAMRWHDLRHATASLLIAEGVGLAVVSAILGHSGIAITVDTYGHLTDDTKRDAMGRLGTVMAAETAVG